MQKQLAREELTLADCRVKDTRCSSCSATIPGSTQVETYPTQASTWIIAQCPSCTLMTPFRLEVMV